MMLDRFLRIAKGFLYYFPSVCLIILNKNIITIPEAILSKASMVKNIHNDQ